MSFNPKVGAVVCVGALVFCVATAGQLFPPVNLETCLSGGILTWSASGDSGHVECIPLPSPIPSGAVMAFTSDGCPEGWSYYSPSAGRAIIGAGAGAGLSYRAPRSWGGAETHQLTVNEMPSHNHSPIHLRGSQSDNGNPGADVITNWTGEEVWGATDIMNSYTGYAGGNAAHNTMMPWLALVYCAKN